MTKRMERLVGAASPDDRTRARLLSDAEVDEMVAEKEANEAKAKAAQEAEDDHDD